MEEIQVGEEGTLAELFDRVAGEYEPYKAWALAARDTLDPDNPGEREAYAALHDLEALLTAFLEGEPQPLLLSHCEEMATRVVEEVADHFGEDSEQFRFACQLYAWVVAWVAQVQELAEVPLLDDEERMRENQAELRSWFDQDGWARWGSFWLVSHPDWSEPAFVVGGNSRLLRIKGVRLDFVRCSPEPYEKIQVGTGRVVGRRWRLDFSGQNCATLNVVIDELRLIWPKDLASCDFRNNGT